MSKPKIRIISQLFYPELISTGQTLTELAESLVELGIDVEVYCAPPSLAKITFTSYTEHLGIRIHRVWATSFPKKNFLGKLINHITFAVSLFFTLLIKPKRPSLVFTNPPFLGVITALLKKIRGIPFIYVVFDVYPHTAIQLGVLKKNSTLSKLWDYSNTFIYQQADRIVFIGRCMHDILVSEIPKKKHANTRIIPVWGDDVSIQNQLKNEDQPFKKRWKCEDKFIVGYSGNMGRFHDIDTLLKAAKQLLSHHDIIFIFSGDGYFKSSVETYINKNPNGNCLLFDYFSREEFGKAIGSFDIGIVSLLESQIGLSVPSKSFGLMAAGIPILGVLPDQCEISRIIEETHCGKIVPPQQPDKLVEAILELKNNKEKLKTLGENGKKAIEKKYSLHQAATSYYNEIITLQEKM